MIMPDSYRKLKHTEAKLGRMTRSDLMISSTLEYIQANP